MLKLSARRSAGAHPYLTTPEHTRQAREVGRSALEIYLNLGNYLNNWKRLGFTGTDKLVSALTELAGPLGLQMTPDSDPTRN